MTIARAEVLVTSPGRNFVTLRITTDDGVVGLGDATLNGRELAAAAYLRDHVAPLLAGRDEDAITDTWQYLYRGAYWRRGPVTMAAVSAVDVALWDIKARKAGMPLYQLLGGPCRTGLLAYGHASGQTIGELLESVDSYRSAGFQAIRVQTGVPGLPSIYGVADAANAAIGGRGRYDYEPARATTAPVQEVWDTRAYLRQVPQAIQAVRDKYGPELILLHDCHHRLTPLQAAQLGKALEPYDMFWIEDPTPQEDQTAFRLIRAHTTTPIATGEVLNSVYDYQTLITERLIDYVRSAVTHTGGITHMRQLMAYAAIYGIKSGFHGPTDVSPVGMAANLHLGLAIHNYGIQEYMAHNDQTRDVFTTSYTFTDGHLHPGNQPGLGVDYNDHAADQHPYDPAYLPINRLTDGTIHDW